MEYTIRVKGEGNISVKPDLIIIEMEVVSHKYDYEDTMKLATKSINILENAIEKVGFDKKDLKTTRFNINTSYKNYYDKENIYQKEFDGYICEQELKLELDLDMDSLSNVINAIAKSNVNPKMDIKFTVKDKDTVREELLINVTENARRKAEVLAKASRVSLGKLVTIDYNWSELNIYSNTVYEIQNKSLAMKDSYAPSIEPEDIKVSDKVLFVWQIK